MIPAEGDSFDGHPLGVGPLGTVSVMYIYRVSPITRQLLAPHVHGLILRQDSESPRLSLTLPPAFNSSRSRYLHPCVLLSGFRPTPHTSSDSASPSLAFEYVTTRAVRAWTLVQSRIFPRFP